MGILIGYLLSGFVFGLLSSSLAERKGYKGYFAPGFFFSIIGLIYVGFLPVRKNDEDTSDKVNAEITKKLVGDIREMKGEIEFANGVER